MLVIARNACKDPLTSNFCLTMTQGSSMRFVRTCVHHYICWGTVWQEARESVGSSKSSTPSMSKRLYKRNARVDMHSVQSHFIK